MWGLDPPKIAPRTALFQFGVAASLFGSVMLFAYAATPEKLAVSRSYPYDGLVKELGGLEENKVLFCSVSLSTLVRVELMHVLLFFVGTLT